MNVLFVKDTKTPFQSIQLLQSMILDALSGAVNVTIRVAGATSVVEYEELLRSHDAIIGTDANLFLARKAADSSCPIILPSYGMATRGLLQIWEWRDGLGQGDTFICSSTADLAGVQRHLNGDQIRVFYAPFPLPNEFFTESHDVGRNRAELLSRFGIGESHSSWILCVGRLNQQKNVHLAIRTVRALIDMGRSVGLLVVGAEDASGFPELRWDNQGYEQDLRNLVKAIDLQDHVFFVGPQNHEAMHEIYSSVDVHLTCSTFRTEDFGLVPVEAMAHGIPTVGPSWGGFWDTIQHGVTGYRVPVHLTSEGLRVDWLAAAHRIDQIISDPDHRRQLSRNCRIYAQGNFTQSLFRDRLLVLISIVVRERENGFRPLALESLVDDDTASFFEDLAERAASQGSLSVARTGLFESSGGARIRAFFSDYVRGQPIAWTKQSIAYLPLPLSVNGNSATSIDRNWHSTVDLTERELQIVRHLNDDGLTITELCELTNSSVEEMCELCDVMSGKGLVLSVDQSAVSR